MREGERGAALLTVLLIVAVIAVLAATALERLRIATRLAGNTVAAEQARASAYAAEVLATTRITDLLARNPDRVTLAGGWSDRPFGLPVAGGQAVARVTDGGNCFNLNGLVREGDPGVYTADPAAATQFARLLRLVGVPAQTAQGVAAATSDWIDSDAAEQAGGAEDPRYARLDQAYRTAGTLMADVSELRAVAGVTPEVFAQAQRWLCALPIAQPSAINVNTLTPEQAPLFAMLLPDTLSVEAARSLLLRRPPMGYGNVDEFWRGPALAGVTAGEAQAQTATVTRWFNLRVDVAQNGAEIEERGLIDARRLPARLIRRQWGEDA